MLRGPGLERLRQYDRAWLSADVIAGVSVAAVAVPIAIAYSQPAGVPPVHGLYASILPLLAYAVFGSSRQLIMAPDAATCAIVAATVLPLAGGDLQRHVSLTAALAIATGIVCIAAGLARLGFLTNFLARPILTGYLNGIAISIIVGQLGRLFGFPLKSGGFFVVIAYIDITGAAVLKEVVEDLTRAGVEVAMAEAKGPAREMLERTGLSQQIGAHRMFRTVESAVAGITAQAAADLTRWRA